MTSTKVGDVAGKLLRAAAALWLPLLMLPAEASGQLIERHEADSLSVQQILEIAARDSVLQRRSDAITIAAELIRGDTLLSARADSLLHGLRELTWTGIDAALHVSALNALLASGTTRGQREMLPLVFDSARNALTRAAILQRAHTLPDTMRRELLLKGLQRAGSASSSYIANLAVLLSVQWEPDGRALLREARRADLIKDERALRLADILLGAGP